MKNISILDVLLALASGLLVFCSVAISLITNQYASIRNGIEIAFKAITEHSKNIRYKASEAYRKIREARAAGEDESLHRPSKHVMADDFLQTINDFNNYINAVKKANDPLIKSLMSVSRFALLIDVIIWIFLFILYLINEEVKLLSNYLIVALSLVLFIIVIIDFDDILSRVFKFNLSSGIEFLNLPSLEETLDTSSSFDIFNLMTYTTLVRFRYQTYAHQDREDMIGVHLTFSAPYRNVTIEPRINSNHIGKSPYKKYHIKTVNTDKLLQEGVNKEIVAIGIPRKFFPEKPEEKFTFAINLKSGRNYATISIDNLSIKTFRQNPFEADFSRVVMRMPDEDKKEYEKYLIIPEEDYEPLRTKDS